MSKKIHFAWFGQTGPGHWNTAPFALYDWTKPDVYQDVARMCERAKFDMVLFADTLAVPNKYKGSNDWYVRNGFSINHDPVPILTMMAAVTTRLGIGSTLSTSFYPPFLLARMLGTLDHLTAGRTLWNVVTSASSSAAANFGLDALIPHDERYDMADEYLALCRALWDSWEPDAVIADRENHIFADPAKVHEINFVGKYYKSQGPLNVVSSPQRRPVISVAGASPRGLRFGVDNGDIVIAHRHSLQDMINYSRTVRQMLRDAGRDPKSIKIFFSIKPVMGPTEEIAKAKYQRNYEKANVEEGLAYLSVTLGHDMSKFDLDKPLPDDLPIQAMKGKLVQIQGMGRPVTLREFARREAMQETFEICGSYEQVADIIQETAELADADGFHFRSSLNQYDYLVEVATQLMPILQKRGAARTEYTGRTLREHLFEF